MTSKALPGGRRDRQALAREVVELAWDDLPREHRTLLESIGVTQHQVVAEPLGSAVDKLRISAGEKGLTAAEQRNLNMAVGVWESTLRLVVMNAEHPALINLDDASYEALLARIAWHEWGHALSIVRATADDVAGGKGFLRLAPPGVAQFIRDGDYRSRQLTHELVAECYALLMSRRRRGQSGQPEWLADEIYELVRRVTGWSR